MIDSDIQIRNRPLSCKLAKIFGTVYFASWGRSCDYFAFSQTRLVEVVMWQVEAWYVQEDKGFRV